MYIHKQICTVKQDEHFSLQYNYCSWFWIKQEDHKFLTFLCHIVTTVCCLWGVQTSSLYLNGTLPRSPSECISSLALTRRPREVSQHGAVCAHICFWLIWVCVRDSASLTSFILKKKHQTPKASTISFSIPTHSAAHGFMCIYLQRK